MIHLRSLSCAALLFTALPALAEDAGPPMGSSELIQRFQIKEARQGVGVDADAFYAVDNTVIAKYDKKTGALIARTKRRLLTGKQGAQGCVVSINGGKTTWRRST